MVSEVPPIDVFAKDLIKDIKIILNKLKGHILFDLILQLLNVPPIIIWENQPSDSFPFGTHSLLLNTTYGTDFT